MEKMTNEEKAKRYNNIKSTITSIGIGTMVGNAGFGIWDSMNAGLDCKNAVIFTGIIAAVVTGISLIKANPYDEIIEEEKEEQPKVKKLENK